MFPAAFSALTTKQNKTCNSFGLWDNLWRVTRKVYLNFGEINRNLYIQKDVVYQSLYATIDVQSLQNCDHFRDNHRTITAEALLEATYHVTVPVICTQTRIHRTQSLHYDKSLKQGSPRYIVTTNFTATI